MVSLEVIDTDAFLDMPVSCQNLYFHLNARADDDGFVSNPKKVVRALSAAPDDLKVLIAKKFVIEFSDGVCVIKHWRINNFVRKDIYKETQYLDLKQTLFIRPNGAYTLSDDERSIPIPKGHFKLEAVESTLTQRQLRIGKDREELEATPQPIVEELEEVTERTKKPPKYPNAPTVFSWFRDPEPSWRMNTTELKHAELLFDRGEKAVRGILKFVAEHHEDDYFPKVTKPSDLERKWNDIAEYKV